MMGMDEQIGKLIEGEAWLRQAVRRAVRTPKRSKVMVRWFGTSYMKHLASPITESSVLDLTGEIADSIERSIEGVTANSIVDQATGEGMQVSIRVGKTNRKIGV